ncbi:DUF5666 domain-containing protein [Marinobacter sp. F3R11]|uniref:DUF5666 domain-containing protein n=1 Tax=Marinobacter sp. F3R11 TaxID=2267231 RepID=UPI000DEB23EB|nr:DUF5666 domain-containing protein [Marinobacter sp. F3R11]RBW48525.1 hypothetical protein DS878_10100 [Marinobacter sp. F3R11]
MQPIPRKPQVSILAATLTFCLISACDSGGLSIADGGIRGTGSSVGPVSGFGSVFVNGVEFFTDGIRDRKVESNDGIDSESDLREGMILRIDGEWGLDGTGTASSMSYDDTLRGTVSELQLDSKGRATFEIHGQQVIADRQTVFKDQPRARLKNGDFVRISAWRTSDGIFRASYIGFNPWAFGENAIELEGLVDSGSLEADQFTMNGLVIRFDESSFTEGFTLQDLKPGMYVEVEGSLDSSGDAVIAAQIQDDDFRLYLPSDHSIDMAGPVSSDFSPDDRTFGLNGLTIRVTDETRLSDVALEELNQGLLVQVEGDFSGGDQVLADEIHTLDSDAAISGSVDTVSVDTGRLSIGGVEVRITPRTIITDDDTENTLTIYDLVPGTGAVLVDVSGLQKVDRNGVVYVEAIQIERELQVEPDGTYGIEGILTQDGLLYSSVTLLGVTIDANDDVFETVSRDQLEALLQSEETVVVEVEYRLKDDTTDQYEASSIELD